MLEGCNEPFVLIDTHRGSAKPYPVTTDDNQLCCSLFHGPVTRILMCELPEVKIRLVRDPFYIEL